MSTEISNLVAPESEEEIIKHWKYTEKVYTSVICITFNQDIYIRDAINSFLAQVTEYKFEIIIHDDVSTDATREILKEYQQKYPSVIKLVLQDENQFSINISMPLKNAIEVAQGQYIAICEGDDFWIENKKLQNQMNILMNNHDISLVHSKFCFFSVELDRFIERPIPNEKNSTEELLIANGIGTLTSMFKKTDFKEYINYVGNDILYWRMSDWPLWIYLSTKGRVYKLNDETAIYRVLANSASHSTDKLKKYLFTLSCFEIQSYFISRLGYGFFYKVSFFGRLLRTLVRKFSLDRRIVCSYKRITTNLLR